MQASPPAFLLGLPALRDGALWRAAGGLQALVLVSANALSVWRADPMGLRYWDRFSHRSLHLVHEHPVYLDSGGFVAAARYRGFPWTVLHGALCCCALDLVCHDACCGQEIAADENAVPDQISMPARGNAPRHRAADDAGAAGEADRPLPALRQPDAGCSTSARTGSSASAPCAAARSAASAADRRPARPRLRRVGHALPPFRHQDGGGSAAAWPSPAPQRRQPGLWNGSQAVRSR